MSRIRYTACKALADHVAGEIPALAGKVRILHGEPEDDAAYPGLTILPRRFSFEPWQEDEVWTPLTSTEMVTEVGTFSGTVELRLLALSGPQREVNEERLTRLFLARAGAPGVLVLTLAALEIDETATLYSAPVAFTLEDGEWHEERVWDKRRYTYMTVGLTLPALVRTTAPLIDLPILAINHDLASDVPVEQVEVTVNGGIIPA
mgnify:CR=1 FL=1